ncbi:MAG: hypothetical protein ACPGOY_02255 [Rhodospirillaceae bacterium]
MAGPANASDGAWVASSFDSNFGPISLSVNTINGEVEGTFPKYRGRLVGTINLDATRLDATWLQPKSEVRCPNALGGTHYWGTVTWILTQGRSMPGTWSYCNNAPTGDWNATLRSGNSPRRAMGY